MIKLIQLESCESTNDEAWKHLPETALIVTKHQTRGRGRQGRLWESGGMRDEGNIMASLCFVPERELTPHVLWLPLAAGVAAIEAITLACRAAPADLRLKWPNDIYWGNAKMGGILCESRVSGENIAGLVVGFGLNLRTAPKIDGMQTASLAEQISGLPDDIRNTILNHWSDRTLFWVSSLARGRVNALRQAWLQQAKLNKFPDFSVHNDKGDLVKLKAIDLDESGRLKASLNSKIIYLDQPA